MICIEIGYPAREVEKEVLVNHRSGQPVDRIGPVISGDELRQLQLATREVKVDDSINDYILDLVTATRTHEELQLGVSTRGAITLYRAVQGQAFLSGRDYAIPDDVKALAGPVLAHRTVLKGVMREGQRERSKAVIRQILNKTATPS